MRLNLELEPALSVIPKVFKRGFEKEYKKIT